MPITIRAPQARELELVLALAIRLFPGSDIIRSDNDVFYAAFEENPPKKSARQPLHRANPAPTDASRNEKPVSPQSQDSPSPPVPRVLGFVHLIPKPDSLFLIGIGVQPDFQRHGIGKRLLERAFQHADEHHYSKIVLKVKPANLPALALYANHGFAVQKEGRALTLARAKPT